MNAFLNNRPFILRPIEHWNLHHASGMDVAATEKTEVKRKLNEDAAAFKADPTNIIISGAKKRISTYFASRCTASSNNQTKDSGSVNITRQKGFTLKLQPTIAQLLDPKISISVVPNVVEEWSQNHVLVMILQVWTRLSNNNNIQLQMQHAWCMRISSTISRLFLDKW